MFKRKQKKPLVSSKLPPISFDKLPPDIARKLKQAVLRIQSIIWLRGLLAVTAALVIAILSIAAVDAMVMIYSSGVRWVMWGCGLFAVAATAVHMLMRPLSRPFTPRRVAAMIEQSHPELEERLSSVVELISNPGTLETGSSQLLDVLTSDAVADVKTVSIKQDFTNRTVKPKLIAAAASFSILALLFVSWPESMGRLIVRAVIPSAEVDNIYADNLGVTPGDTVVLRGQPLAIELAIFGGFPGQAYLRSQETETGKRGEVVERMRKTSAETSEDKVVRYYQHAVAEVKESFRYRVACGSALTRFYDVKAVPIPAYTSIEIKNFYPQYTGIEPRTNDTEVMEITAVAGTEVKIKIQPERELACKLILADGDHPAVMNKDGTASWSFSLSEKTAGMWSLELSDTYGFTNKPASFPVRILKDQPPTIEIEAPEKLTYVLPPYGKLPFSYLATDDFGISVPEMRISLDNAPFERLQDAAMVQTGPGAWRGDDAIDLAKIKTEGAAHLRVQLAVRDNLPPELGGPQEAFTASFDITLDRNADSMAAQMMAEQFAEMDIATAAIMDALEKAKKSAQSGLDEIDRKSDETAVARVGESLENIVKAEDLIRDLMNKSESSLFDGLIPEMKQLLSGKVEPAHKQADEAILTNAETRRPEVVRLIALLSEAIEAAAEFKEAAEEMKEEVKEMTEMSDLADKQEALAEEAKEEEMTPEEMEQWRKEQEELKKEFEEATDEIEEPLDAAIKQANELAEKIQELKKEEEGVKDLADKLGKEEEKEDAAAELEKKTPDMPEGTSPEDRAKALQEDIAKEAEALNEEVSNMSDDFKALDQSMADMTQPVTEPLSNAADKMDKAQEDAGEAAEEMAEKENAGEKMEDAAENMEAAADAMKKAAEAMEGLSDKLEEMANEAAEEASKAMEDAMAAAEEAKGGEKPPEPAGAPPPADPNAPPQPGKMGPAGESAQKAAEAMKSLAEQLAQQAGMPGVPMPGKMKGKPGKPTPDSKGAEDTNPGEVPTTRGVPEALLRLGFTLDWFKTKGEMSSGALDDSLESVPPEYRELVKAYFIELSKEAK